MGKDKNVIVLNGEQLTEFLDTGYTGNKAFNFQSCEGCEGRMETHGESLQRVLDHLKVKPNTVWTVVECDDGELVIVAGYHIVNRLEYFISNEPWQNSNEEYIW